MASIALDSSDAGSQAKGVVNIFTAMLLTFIPLVLIPYAFKLAGGAIGAIMAAASGSGDRLGQRYNKWREDPNSFAGAKRQKAQQERYRHGVVGSQILAGASGGLRGVKTRQGFRSGYSAASRTLGGRKTFEAASELMENNQAFQAIKKDDDKLWGLVEGDSDEEIRRGLTRRAESRFNNASPQEMNEAIAEIKRVKGQAGSQVSQIAGTRAQAATGTGFLNSGEMVSTINSAARGDRSLAGQMLGEMRGAAMQSERVDLGGGGFTDTIGIMDRLAIAQANGGVDPTTGLRFDQRHATEAINQSVLRGNAAAAVSGRIQSIEQLAPTIRGNAQAALGSDNKREAARQLATLADRYDAASQISPQNAQEFANQVLERKVDTSQFVGNPDIMTMLQPAIMKHGTDITYQQAIEAARGDSDFLTFRREYGDYSAQNAAASAAAAAAAGGGPKPGGPTPGGPTPGGPTPGGIP